MIVGLDHIQLALPAGAENQMRAFYCGLLGMTEVPKPISLQGRGGFWARVGALEYHFGIDPDFHAATKAHPAFVISDLDSLAQRLFDAGHQVTWDNALAQVSRFFANDPVGNRLEFIAQGA